MAAVLALRVPAPTPDRRAILVIRGAPAFETTTGAADAIGVAWIADAAAGMARDEDLRRAAREIPARETDRRFQAQPWQTIADAADGRPVVVAAQSAGRLLVVSAAEPTNLATPALIRSIFDAIGRKLDVRGAEIVPIPDHQLRAWERPAADPSSTRLRSLDEDDRRGFWALALLLLAIESVVRRTRADAAEVEAETTTRVA
jgi:hypothetical protein